MASGESVDRNVEKFNFPYNPPYDIQVKFMEAAYQAFENGNFGLLESPTGTGKSISLICSSLTWLQEHRAKQNQSLLAKKEEILSQIMQLKEEEEMSGDWLTSQAKVRDLNKLLAAVDSEIEQVTKFDQRHALRWSASLHGNLEEVNLEQPKKQDADESIVAEEEDEDIEKSIKERAGEEHVSPKIYYASRTHSQLSQFIRELKKTKFADATRSPPIKLTPLASRAITCINSDVTKLNNSSAINERCAELQREAKKENRCPYARATEVHKLKEHILSRVSDIEDIVQKGRTLGCCPYYATRMAVAEADVVVLPYNNLLHHETRRATSLDLRGSLIVIDEAHNILETICSIHSASINFEQLLGSHTILSRYYTKFHSRMAPRNAEMVKSIVQCLTAVIKFVQDPSRHLNKYESTKSVNLDDSISETPNKIKTIADVSPQTKSSIKTSDQEFMIDVMKFIGAANIERFNIFKIIDFFNRSQLARKLIGFYRQNQTIDLTIDINGLAKSGSTKEETPDGNAKKKRKLADKKQPMKVVCNHERQNCDKLTDDKENTKLSFLMKVLTDNSSLMLTSYPIYALVEFLRSLTNLSHDGKVYASICPSNVLQSTIKFVLLNPASQFKQMAEESRSIVLAGGTMQPFDEYTELLFEPLSIKQDNVATFSCGHVISSHQLYMATITKTSKSTPLELSFKTKNASEMLDEYARNLVTIAQYVPGGVVCFFPSYEYEQKCFKRWTDTGMIYKIKKRIIREPRNAKDTKTVLDDYTREIQKQIKQPIERSGAVLFCIVGGKMSEGINFNDHLARCVIMIGVPYANIASGELQQKMNYYDRTCARAKAGQRYYQNLCIKGVNQSIGRAIRHAKDYAAIFLLDHRYAKPAIKAGLPEWMHASNEIYDKSEVWREKLQKFYKIAAEREPRLVAGDN